MLIQFLTNINNWARLVSINAAPNNSLNRSANSAAFIENLNLLAVRRARLIRALDASAGRVIMMTNWLEQFFHDYAEDFRSKSKARLLAKFCLPLTFLTKSGPIALDDEESLSANLDALMRRYKQIEAVDWTYTIRDVRAIGSGIHLVEIEWRFFNAEKELLYTCDTSYFLAGEAKRDAKVMAIIAHNENEEYEKALQRKGGV